MFEGLGFLAGALAVLVASFVCWLMWEGIFWLCLNVHLSFG